MRRAKKLSNWLIQASAGSAFAISTCAVAWSDSAMATEEALKSYLAKDGTLSLAFEAVNLPIPKSSKTIPAARHRASGVNCAMPKDTNLERLTGTTGRAECFYVSSTGVEVAVRISLSPANDLSELAQERFKDVARQLGAETTLRLETNNAWTNATKYGQLKFAREGKDHFTEVWFTKAGDWFVEVQSTSPDSTNPFYRHFNGARLLATVRTNPAAP